MSTELEQKRLELEQLFSEIKKIEAATPQTQKKSRGPVPFREVNDASTTVQYVQVEAQLQETLAELDRYKVWCEYQRYRDGDDGCPVKQTDK